MASNLEKLPSGHTVEIIKGEEERKLKKAFNSYADGVIRLNPGNWIYPKTFLKFAPHFYNFEVKPTDIYVSTFPKSGTTWMQEIIWNLVHNPDGDKLEANISIDQRFPNFEADILSSCSAAPELYVDASVKDLFDHLCGSGDYRQNGIFIHLCAILPEPRMSKVHLPLSLLPPNLLDTSKVVCVMRDPRDVIVSLYYYAKLQRLWGYKGTFDEFIDYVINDQFHFGPFWAHLSESWSNRHHKNMLLTYYEDMLEDTERVVKMVNEFLQTKRTDEQIKKVIYNTSFSKLKERSKENPPSSNSFKFYDSEAVKDAGTFFRKGKSGDWRTIFTEEQVKKVNNWILKHIADFGEDFKYKV